MSGGTIASIRGLYEDLASNPELRPLLEDPRSLRPDEPRDAPDSAGGGGLRYDRAIGQWVGPSFLARLNEKVVHRTNALLGDPWGRNFQYRERIPAGSGLAGAATAAGITAGMALFHVTMSVRPLRSLADRLVLPDPGEGPSRETIEESSFEVRLLGSGTTPSAEPFTVEGTVACDLDPGYGATALMLTEAAACLAAGETDSALQGGVLTPASGIGTPLIERLRDAGMTFGVSDGPAAG